MTIRFLLITDPHDSSWQYWLEQALMPLGQLRVVQADYAVSQIAEEEYNIVIVDATAIEEVELLASRLRATRPDCRIVVMTASPTWQRARAAFEAGAIDYIPKSFNKDKLLDTFKQILQKPLPAWPR